MKEIEKEESEIANPIEQALTIDNQE